MPEEYYEDIVTIAMCCRRHHEICGDQSLILTHSAWDPCHPTVSTPGSRAGTSDTPRFLQEGWDFCIMKVIYYNISIFKMKRIFMQWSWEWCEHPHLFAPTHHIPYHSGKLKVNLSKWYMSQKRTSFSVRATFCNLKSRKINIFQIGKKLDQVHGFPHLKHQKLLSNSQNWIFGSKIPITRPLTLGHSLKPIRKKSDEK